MTILQAIVLGVVQGLTRVRGLTQDDSHSYVTPEQAADEVKHLLAFVLGLLRDFVVANGGKVVVRGLRAVSDFEYEFQFAHMNRRLAPTVDTVFFMTDERNHYVSSSLVKEVASLGGDVTGLVPPPVVQALKQKYGRT